MAKKNKKEIEIEIEMTPKDSRKIVKEKKLHEAFEGKETASFKDAEYHLALAKKHHMQALHHNKIAESMEKKRSKKKKDD